CMEESDIVPYQGDLVPLLQKLFVHPSFKIKGITAGCIGSIAASAGTAFLPYFDQSMHLMQDFVTVKGSQDELELRASIIDAMGEMSASAGPENFKLGTACVSCLARGGPSRCEFRDPLEVKPRPSWVKETSPKKKGTVAAREVEALNKVRGNSLVVLGDWAASAGVRDWEVAIEEAKGVLEAAEACHEYAKRDVVGAAVGRL
ncbi:hypothetical protein KEM55_006180, partial [Ascosphaera atra]